MEKNWIFADLHIHSKYSRACSKDLNFENLVKWARVKGLNLLGTGDFTHPKWLEEIKKLKEKNGIFWWIPSFSSEDEKNSRFPDKSEDNNNLLFSTHPPKLINNVNEEKSNSEKTSKKTERGFPFILSSEISLIYTKNGKGRKVHLVYLAPSVEIVEKINAWLDTKGRRDYDGRPIFGISCRDFVAKMKEIDDRIEVICAHSFTPWFGIFGSEGGFDRLKDAFEDQIENIHAVETGISADPEMCWRIHELDNKAIISFSDCHSFWPWRLGREATIFLNPGFDSEKPSFSSEDEKDCRIPAEAEFKLTYDEIIRQIREKDFIGTIEADPAYGKYHFDGHRNCNFSCSPEETKKLKEICPVCHKELVIGVDYRVGEIAKLGNANHINKKIFYKVLPLHEIISMVIGVGVASKKTWGIYNKLIENFGNEFNILLDVKKEDLMRVLNNDLLVEMVLLNREGKIQVVPGYDGVYGKAIPSFSSEDEKDSRFPVDEEKESNNDNLDNKKNETINTEKENKKKNKNMQKKCSCVQKKLF